MNINNPRICILTTRNIFDAPCLAKYQSLLQEPFDIVYWDRCGIQEECGATNYFRYNGFLPANAGKMEKIQSYLRFLCFANRILEKRDYAKLIVFPTQMGWLIQGKLCNKYKGRYVLGIEDYAGENHLLISFITQRIVMNAGLCSITSPAYKTFLPKIPKKNYVISHNIQPIDKEIIQRYRTRIYNIDRPIVLSFIGSVRFIEQQKKLISLFKNDIRFQLKYIGKGSDQLADFCRHEDVDNVTLIGRFDRTQLSEFYLETDMAINVYGNHDPYLDYALSNKLYSAAMMGMPILVSPDTYMAEISKYFGFGYCVDLDDSSTPDKVFEYYRDINRNTLFSGCDNFVDSVYQDEEKYIEIGRKFLNTVVESI